VIHELTLIDASISESECRSLAQNIQLQDLKILNLSCNPIGTKGFQNLLKEGKNFLKNLEKLIIFDCRIRSFESSNLISLEKLKHLNMSHNKYMGKVLETPAEEVYLINCGLKCQDMVLEALSENLRVLDISENDKMAFDKF
jgi:hypothetical protein